MRSRAINRDTHRALKSDVVSNHRTDHLETLLVRLQWGKDGVGFSAHVNPLSFTSYGIQRTDFLDYLGFSQQNCSFIVGNKCYTRWVDEKFDPKTFAEAFDSAYVQLAEAQRGLQNCGISLRQTQGWNYFLGTPSRSYSDNRSSLSGEGHTGTQKETLNQSEDDVFLFKFTWLVLGAEKAWITHYHPKHPPLSSELEAVFSYLGLRQFDSCPEFNFEPCFFRSTPFENHGDSPFESNVNYAHGAFNAHASQFSPAVQKLLSANAEIERVGFPFLIAQKPIERLGLDIEVKTRRPQRTQPSLFMASRSARHTLAIENFDVAISFAGTEREHAQKLAELVSSAGFSVFYDEFHREFLWGKDLVITFDEIFRKRARYCVIFVSKTYKERVWTTHEIRSAQARALNEKGRDYILPIKVDDTELDGLLPTIGYLPLEIGVDKISEILINKLRS
jgi:TIR domain